MNQQSPTEPTALHQRYGLTPVINASGTFTPLGVSRSPASVADTVAAALGDFFIIDELQTVAGCALARATGAEAATITHCVAAGITLAIAATMTGRDADRIAALPDTSGMRNRVVLPAGHAVNYGHPIVTDIRLAGATPVLVGTASRCSLAELDAALAEPQTTCLLLVSSRLITDSSVDLSAAVAAAHRHQVPVVIDGAAQDMRLGELLATGADLVLASAHKYLASPTAGLVIGQRALVDAVAAQALGIGRAMKPTKEAILGVLAALEHRDQLDQDAWRSEQADKLAWFVTAANRINGLRAQAVPDPSGMPLARVRLDVLPIAQADVRAADCADGDGYEGPASAGTQWQAAALAATLKAGTPSIWLMTHAAAQGQLMLELVPLTQAEMQAIIDRLTALAPDPIR